MKMSFFALELDLINKSIELIGILARIFVNFKTNAVKNSISLFLLIEMMLSLN